MSETAQSKVAWRGVNITARQRDALRWAERLVQKKHPGVTLLPAQGSWNSSVNASGTTHAKAGAVDLRTVMYNDLQRIAIVVALKKAGMACWYRPVNWDGSGGGEHIHVLDRVTTNLSPSAAWQVGQYDRGMNGLTSARRDPSFRVKPSVKFNYRLGRPV
jgi:hypothetical protein